MTPDLSTRVLQWYDQHGRKDLPWQRDRDPYRIWVSEIMLQQTQVATVIPFYRRFLDRFPDIPALAAGDVDDVLHLWTGLGYYARARNLHRAAQVVRDEHDGVFPSGVEQVYRLPGIGRSTAHAILAFAFDQVLPILDGNVKRVITRHHRVHGWPGGKQVQQELWRIAQAATPHARTADYTQAIMDLGATICVRRRPLCALCPLAGSCQALVYNEQSLLPTPAPKRDRPVRAVTMIMLQQEHSVLLEQRPPQGIWGGLWSFPEVPADVDPAGYMLERYGLEVEPRSAWDVLRHGFTHFHLHITPLPATLVDTASRVMENPGLVWYNLTQPDTRGLAAPVKKLLQKLG